MAVLMLAVLPSNAGSHGAVVRVDGSGSDGEAQSSAGCGSGSVSMDSVGGHLYKYCGQHWPLNKLPLRIHINGFGAKPNAGAFIDAVRSAVVTWDSIAPVSGTGPRGAGCSATSRIMCVSSVSNGPGASGEIDVGWASRGPLGYPGVAHVSGPTPGLITDVSITFNWDLAWFGSDDYANTAIGAGVGLAGGICPVSALCPPRYDLEGIALHELGHALGLEDLNPDDGTVCDNNDALCGGWPQDLNDAPDYTQVMYAFYYPGSSLKRIPQAGDILGLYRILLGS